MSRHAILFDMDGVIVDSMRFHAAAWKQVLGEYGVLVNDIDIYLREGMSGRQSVEDIFFEYGRAFPDERMFQNLIDKKHALFESNQIVLYPCVEAILELIKGRNMLTGLVTGSLKRSVHHLLSPGVLSQFNVVVTAEDVLKGKPDPEPYARAIEMLGVKPEMSLIIENAPMGIRSAKSAGATCYALETTLPERYLKEADKIVRDHRSLLEILQSGFK
jgi:HAD superfamily hydrolase (TIGR01509 family)